MTSAPTGGGGQSISDQRKGGCVNLVLTRGEGGGLKSQKIRRRHMYMPPYLCGVLTDPRWYIFDPWYIEWSNSKTSPSNRFSGPLPDTVTGGYSTVTLNSVGLTCSSPTKQVIWSFIPLLHQPRFWQLQLTSAPLTELFPWDETMTIICWGCKELPRTGEEAASRRGQIVRPILAGVCSLALLLAPSCWIFG